MKTKQFFLLKMIFILGISILLCSNSGSSFKNTHKSTSIEKNLFLNYLRDFNLLTIDKEPEDFLAENQPFIMDNGNVFYTKQQLKYILASFNILGCGGGGSYYDALTILNAMEQEGVEVVDVANTDNTKLYVVAGGMGQPSALKANIPATIASIQIAINRLVQEKGMPLGGILNVESGPVNGILAVLMAAKLGVPVVNADGGGRSVPSLTNLTYAYENYPIAPVVLKPLNTDIQIYNVHTADEAEAQIGTFMKNNNVTIAGLALWGQTGQELKASQISKGSYTNAYAMGIYTSYTMARANPYYLETYLNNNNKFLQSSEETLVDYEIRNVENRFDAIDLTTTTKKIKAVNENLLIRNRFETDTIHNAIATAPNLISFLIKGKGEDGISDVYLPYNNGDIDELTASIGKKIYLLQSKAPQRVYELGDSFLAVLRAVIGYEGTVKP